MNVTSCTSKFVDYIHICMSIWGCASLKKKSGKLKQKLPFALCVCKVHFIMAKASNYHLFIEMCWRNMKETQDWYKSCRRSKLFIILTPVIIKQSHFWINSEFNTGCDGLYSYSLFIFLLGDLNCEYFFCSLGWKSGLNFLSQFCSHLNLLDLHAKQGSGLISNFIQFFFWDTNLYNIRM